MANEQNQRVRKPHDGSPGDQMWKDGDVGRHGEDVSDPSRQDQRQGGADEVSGEDVRDRSQGSETLDDQTRFDETGKGRSSQQQEH
jgi:hypothetical protein